MGKLIVHVMVVLPEVCRQEGYQGILVQTVEGVIPQMGKKQVSDFCSESLRQMEGYGYCKWKECEEREAVGRHRSKKVMLEGREIRRDESD
jgi:hypothetical protein